MQNWFVLSLLFDQVVAFFTYPGYNPDIFAALYKVLSETKKKISNERGASITKKGI